MLVVAVARRDKAALAELYRRHAGSLVCAALRVLSVREPAEEVAQDILIGLWRRPERFDAARGSLRSFLLAQCHSRATDIVRAERARRRREDGEDTARAAYVLEDEVLDFVAEDKLREAVGTLDDCEREAISLAYFGGHTYVDVASILHVPEDLAKSRIRSGLTRLRAALIDRGVDPFRANTALVDGGVDPSPDRRSS